MNKIDILNKLDLQSFYNSELASLKVNGKDTGQALCPFHEDTRPSLSINLKTGAFSCFGCNSKGDVFTFYMKKHNADFKTALMELAERAGNTTKTRKISKVYDYVDASGKLVFQVVRFTPKGFSQRRPDGKGGWIWNLQGVSLIPYNLPAVIKADTIFIVEGERDAETLKELGLIASCNPMGAGKWRAEFNEHFKGKRIVIIPDNDNVGRDHALTVARNLKGIAESVKVIELPGLSEKQDVSNWIQARQAEGKTAEKIKSELQGLVDACPEWSESLTYIGETVGLIDSLLKWNDIISLDINTEYLLDRLIPKGSITLLFGRGGIGKTSLSLQLCKAIAEGLPYGDLQTIKTPAYFIDFENPLSVLKQRAESIGKSENFWVWHLSGKPQPPRLDTNEWELYKQLPAGLLVFDTLRASHLADENNSQDMANVMARLKELREAGFTILLLHHTPKGNEGIYRGSTALLDLVDSCLGLEEIKDDDSLEFGRDNIFRFGVRIKTRYDPHHIFLKFNPDMKGFEIAKDPDTETMESIRDLLIDKADLNTNQVYEIVKRELDIRSKAEVIKLLKKGERNFWNVEVKGRAKIYSPIVQTIYTQTIGLIDNNSPDKSNINTQQSLDNPIKSNSPKSIQTDRLIDLADIIDKAEVIG